MLRCIVSAVAALVVVAGAPAQAKDLSFTSNLVGNAQPTLTGSKAIGTARIVVHTDSQTVDLALDVTGLKVEDLWAQLVAAPMGPIHLHRYSSHDHSASNDASLVFPAPFGPSYSVTPNGFQVVMKDYPYAQAARLVRSEASFDEFVASLDHGGIVLNIHTNAHHEGEISGDVVPAA